MFGMGVKKSEHKENLDRVTAVFTTNMGDFEAELYAKEAPEREEGVIMPGRRNSSLKDPKLYEELRDDGASKQKAARISNAAAKTSKASVGRKGGTSGPYDDWTLADLRKRAKELGMTGYSSLTKPKLISKLRNS